MRNRLLRLCSSLGLAAAVCYIGLSAAPLFARGTATVRAEAATVRESFPLAGVFLRSEQILPRLDGTLELDELRRVVSGEDLGGLKAPASGYFTADLDGYEHISLPEELTPPAVMALTDDRRVAVASPGKIITSSRWQFAAVMESVYAGALTAGGNYILETDHWGGVELRLETVGGRWGDFTALLFSGAGDMDTVAYLRQTDARLVAGEYSGLRVPSGAVYERGGELFAEVMQMGRPCEVSVEKVYEGEGFDLIVSDELWDGSEVLLGADKDWEAD